MELTSPRITALNQIEHSFPIKTSPTIVAEGAIKQSSGILGVLPFKFKIVAIYYDT
jgi:hypothetical protein